MTLRTKTVEYSLDTRTANLATNTTLGTATRYDTTVYTIYIPETTSRTFRSVHVVINWRDAFTTVYNVSGWRVGIKLGATAYTDTDYTPTAISNTGDHEHSIFKHDVTSYFVSNFGGGTSQTVQVGFAMATATAANINNISIKLIITYEYDDSGQSTLVKTVRIPLQSHHALNAAAEVEFGTTGGTNNAPANQIPNLDTFLPESNKSYKNIWVEFFANDAGAAATNFNAIMQVDAIGTATRATLTQNLNTGTVYYDNWVWKYIDSGGAEQNPYSVPTNATHAIKLNSSLASRFDAFGGILHVTYTYDASSSTVMNSVILPLDTNPGFVGSTAAADANYLSREFWVEEPTTITLAQSGVFLTIQSPGGATFRILAGSQAERSYTLTSLVNSGGHYVIHRVDHNSGFSLSRGKNTLLLKYYTTAAAAANTVCGYAIINYTSAVSNLGEGAHNHSTSWYIANQLTTGSVATMTEIATTNQRTPNIPESYYFINGWAYELVHRVGVASVGISIHAEKLAGEFNGDGWSTVDSIIHTNDGELCTTRYISAGKELLNVDSNQSGQMNIESARKYRIHATTGGLFTLTSWLTYHSIYYNVVGNLVNYVTDGAGVGYYVFRTDNFQLVESGTTQNNGYYSGIVFDNVNSHFSVARQDSTHMGRSNDYTPG